MNKILLVVSMLAVLIIYVALSREGEGDDNASREKQACEIVDKIINKKYGIDGLKCKKLEVKEKIADGFFRGQVYLSNGSIHDVGIEEQNDQIRVVLSLF